MRARFLLGAIVVVAAPAAAAASADWLTGRWVGEGRVLGQPSRATLIVEPVLDGRFVEMRYETARGADAKRIRFEGRAMYRREPDGRWIGNWFDSTGAVRPLSAVPTDDAVSVEWGTEATELGRTIYIG